MVGEDEGKSGPGRIWPMYERAWNWRQMSLVTLSIVTASPLQALKEEFEEEWTVVPALW